MKNPLLISILCLAAVGSAADDPEGISQVAIADIINGTALQKPIQLTSNTPIDLTLDTSLNFDELLKSYAEAWSKTLAQTGQSN